MGRRTFYTSGTSPYCEKVRLALALDGLAHDSVEIDPSNHAEVKAATGHDRLPVLVEEDGSVFVDASEILGHLVKRPGSKLLPRSRRDQALSRVLAAHANTTLAPLVARLAHGKDPEGNAIEEDEKRVLEERLAEQLAVFEGLLERGPFLFGGEPTMADVVIHAFLGQLPRIASRPLPPRFGRVVAWYGRLEDLCR